MVSDSRRASRATAAAGNLGRTAQLFSARGTRAMGPGPEHDEEQEEPDEGKPRKLTPLVRRHPVTSELALHGSPQSFLKFEGIPVEESRTLL